MSENTDPADPGASSENRPSRPLKPTLDRAAAPGQRPVRPVTASRESAAPPPVVDYSQQQTARPVSAMSLKVRQTLIPSSLVLGIGFIANGAMFFLQPPQSALRHVETMIPVTLIALGGASLVMTIVTIFSVRRDLIRQNANDGPTS